MASRAAWFVLAFLVAVSCGGRVLHVDADGGADASSRRQGGATTGAGGDAADWWTCIGHGQDRCVAATPGCCVFCDMPELGAYRGVNANSLDAFHQAFCPVPRYCPGCDGIPNPYIGAQCVSGRCEVFDVRKLPALSACLGSARCVLRKGLECCECNSQGPWTAVTMQGRLELERSLCDGITCAPCTPVPPTDLDAVCYGGHCEVWSPPPGR